MKAFTDRFGHLRPGTYDIDTPAYGSMTEVYLKPIIDAAEARDLTRFSWTNEEADALDFSLADTGLNLDASGFLRFASTAIAGREYAKFVFTRLLSEALDRIASEARKCGIPKEQMACVPLDAMLTDSVEVWGTEVACERVLERTRQRAERYGLAGLISLPPVLTASEEVFAFAVPRTEPNFVTMRRSRAPLFIVDEVAARKEQVAGKIVAIRNADPGFDYLFSLGIKGLITAFGGPNSHMAIRASEFGLPAVIGIGSNEFEELKDGAPVEIDCQKRSWRVEQISSMRH